MKRAIKCIWIGINFLAILVFGIAYICLTWRLFLPPYESLNIIFIFLFLISAEGFVESFISCCAADEKSWKCWASQLCLTVAIVLLFCTSYQLFIEFKQTLDEGAATDNPVAVIVTLFVLLVPTMLSPMLISKYSSWALLFINLFGDHDSKTKIILPIVLIIVNIAATIILNQLELTQEWLIAYICIFGTLSIVSFIFTIK